MRRQLWQMSAQMQIKCATRPLVLYLFVKLFLQASRAKKNRLLLAIKNSTRFSDEINIIKSIVYVPIMDRLW
jgi:hypothetical protein